ncbi:MAG TPA: carboxypeptidase-like regulatory domain-containing protein [Bacteroidales bacterium]|nr:carboxypeptidase-like regulatory domain-containing protein [Bacteroidales bacterium]
MKPMINQILRTGLFLLAIFGFFGSYGQSEKYYTVTGTVKDSKTGEVIVFASVSVPGTDIGTVTNSEGEFTLKISKALNATTFEISHLSYVNKQFKIEESMGKRETFYLDQHVFQLSAVPIRPLDARDIVYMALRNIGKNFSEKPNMMTGFYRESVRQRRDYLSIAEAVVDIYKAPYTGYQSDQVKVFKGRTGSNVKKADTLMVQLQGGPHVALLLDIVKNTDLSIALDNLDNYKFDIVNIVNVDNKPNYVIGFQPNVTKTEPLYNGKLYIDMDNLAISTAEFSLDLSDQEKASNLFVQKKPAGLLFTPTSTNYLVTYKNQNGKFYLNYVRIELKFKCDWKRKWFKNNYTITSEVAITDRHEDNIVKFASQEQFRSNMIFANQVKDFTDENFWGENNIIHPEESIQNAIKKIARNLKE